MAKLSVSRFSNNEERQEYYLNEVDQLAEQVRARHITSGSGQAMTYEIKHQEALAGGGPTLEAEAEALGVTLEEVIDSVLEARQKWVVSGRKIEAARLKAKQTIRNSSTASEMHNVVKSLNFSGNQEI